MTLRLELEVLDSIHEVVNVVSLEDWVHGIQQGQSSVTSCSMKLHTGLSKQDQAFRHTIQLLPEELACMYLFMHLIHARTLLDTNIMFDNHYVPHQ